MVDAHTQKPIRVLPGGTGVRPLIKVPLELLGRVRELLERHEIPHWVEKYAIMLDNKPYIAFINLSRDGDMARVQALLDEVE